MPRTVAIRLGTEGKAQVKADFDEIAVSGDASAKRWKRSFEQAGDDVQAAMQRQANAAAKIAAIVPQTPVQMRIADSNSTGFGQWEGSARQSAAAFRELYAEQERLEVRTRALLASINPAAAAQDRFNAEMAEARSLISQGAISLDDYAAKLRQQRAVLEAAGGPLGRHTAGATANRMAMQGASYQVQDFITQVSMGANPINAFAVQGAQLAGQFSSVEGKAGNLARFFMGPWGLAITGGVMMLGMLTKGLWDEDKATTAAKKATEDHRKAILDLADAQGKSIQTAERQQAITVAIIAAEVQAAIATRNSTQALLERAQAVARIAAEEARGGSFSAEDAVQKERDAARADQRVAEIEKMLGTNAAELAKLQKGFNDGYSRLVGMNVDARSTREGEVELRARRARERAMQSLSGVENGDRLAARLREINAARDRELEAIRASTQARTRDADTLTANSVAKMLRGALPGVQVTSTTGGKHVANSYHYRNQAVDFVPAGGMGSMTKEDVRRLFTSRGIDIVELLGPGDKGHSNHFHVAWTKGKQSLDEFNDAAKRTKDAQEELERKEKERAATLAALVSQFDPARAAGDEYAATLAKIAAVNLDPAQVAAYTASAREAFIKARADAFVLPDVEANRPALEDAIKADQDAAEQRVKWGKAGAEALASEQDRLAYAREQMRLVGRSAEDQDRLLGIFGLQVRLSKELGAEYENWAPAILQTAAATDEQNARLRASAAAMDELRGFGTEFVDTVLSEDTWSSWGNAGRTILGMLKSEFLKLALLNPLKNMINGDDALPTLSSAIGNIGKLFGKNAAGTEWWSGGMSLVGEHGAEIVNMPRGSRVSTAAETRQLFSGAGGARGDTHVHVYANDAVLADTVRGWVADGMSAAAAHGAAGGAAISEAESSARQVRRLGRNW